MPLAVAELVNHVAQAESGSEHPPRSGTRHEHPAYEIAVATGPGSGQRIELGPLGITIGSSEACTLQLVDPAVARVHCEIGLEGSIPRIVDLGSPGGILVNGVPVRQADLHLPCSIRLGETELHLLPGDRAPQAFPTRDAFPDVVGVSREMRRVFSLLEAAAISDDAVLLRGEPGSGKDHIARALHAASKRRRGPFVTVDCGALTEELLQVQLFGASEGESLPEVARGAGSLGEAEGGTLYLERVGELPVALAERLLRTLRGEGPDKAGPGTGHRPDVRVIASTQLSLAEAVNRGNFSEALFRHLTKLEVKLPPLRDRPEDVLPLAAYFYRRCAKEGATLPAALESSLTSHSWPGNIRDLRNFVERSASLKGDLKGGTGSAATSVSPAFAREVPSHLPLKDARDAWTNQFEFLYVKALLERTGWDLGVAANLAGVHRRSMQRLVANLKLKKRGSP